MADIGIKKVIIKKSDLPNPVGNNTTLDYNIRYRVISEDQNRFSHLTKSRFSWIKILYISGKNK